MKLKCPENVGFLKSTTINEPNSEWNLKGGNFPDDNPFQILEKISTDSCKGLAPYPGVDLNQVLKKIRTYVILEKIFSESCKTFELNPWEMLNRKFVANPARNLKRMPKRMFDAFWNRLTMTAGKDENELQSNGGETIGREVASGNLRNLHPKLGQKPESLW